MREECFDCEGDFDHCHGTLVVHLESGVERTDEGCDDPDRLRHGLIVDCDGGGCRCAPRSVPVGLPRAS